MSPNKKPSTEEKEIEPEENFINQKNDESSNGLLLNEIYIPEELLPKILKHVDNKTLLLCHLACRKWDALLKDYVWRKKAEYVTGRKFSVDKNVPWTSYYYLCDNRPFGKNLIYDKVAQYRNHAVTIVAFRKGEDIPVNITPFPDDDTFQGICIITNAERCYHKAYVIDLLEEGFTEHILDKLQPIVTVSEWYAAEKGLENVNYKCTYNLLDSNSLSLREFDCQSDVEKKGEWIKLSDSFKNYGEGLRKIRFYHSGSFGVVMVGASVTLEVNMYHKINARQICRTR